MRHSTAMAFPEGRGNDGLSKLLAQYFGTRIAEDPLGCRIKLDNRTLAIDADNAIQCRLQDGPLASFALPQPVLCPRAFHDQVLQSFVGGLELCGALDHT